MPSREWMLRIQDILTAARENVERTQKISFEQFELADSLLIKGILYNFIIIGEAAINIPEEIQFRYSDIPWRSIIQIFPGVQYPTPTQHRAPKNVETRNFASLQI